MTWEPKNRNDDDDDDDCASGRSDDESPANGKSQNQQQQQQHKKIKHSKMEKGIVTFYGLSFLNDGLNGIELVGKMDECEVEDVHFLKFL